MAFVGRQALISEWWQAAPNRRRGTFHITIWLADDEPMLPASDLATTRRLVAMAKPKSRSFTLVASHLATTETPVRVGISAGGGPVLMVEPELIDAVFTPRVWLAPRSGAPLEVQ